MKKVLIVSILTAMLVSCICCANKAARPSDDAIDADSVRVIDISPNANVEWQTYCKACGHVYSFTSSEGVIGLSKSELENRFHDWKIETFSREYVLLKRSIDGYCPDHHVIFLEGDKLVVYSITEPELTMEKLLDFDASPYQLGPIEKAMLKKGVAFSSLKELDDYTDLYLKDK